MQFYKSLLFFFTTSLLPLTIIAILVNCYVDTKIWNLWAEPVDLSQLAIVKRINYFNTIVGVCLTSGVIYHAWEFKRIFIDKKSQNSSEKDIEME